MRIVIVAVAAALLVAACGSTATPLPASQAPASPIASPSASVSAAASAASPSAAASASAAASIGAIASASFALPSGVSGPAAAALSAIEQAMQGGTAASPPAWLSEITGADVNGSTLVVKTSLASKTADATDMCTAFSGAVFGGAASVGITGFEIQGASGQTLITKTSAGASC